MADVSDEVLPGVIGDRYETVRLIGRGGMGSVWLANDTLLGRQVALKQIGALPGEGEGEAERARREARSAAALNHPNVVALYDAITHEGAPWLVMEYVSGPTLSAWVREHGPLDPEAVAEIGARLASGLVAAHRAGIVHRDIKPANVFMADDGEPKIGDFGTARGGGGEDHLTLAGVVTGTPSYMAPEVADGGEHADAADVWGLGATLYFAVEGEDAYPGRGNALATLRSIATRPPRTPERAGVLEPVLAQMLTHDPDRRGDMHDAMRRLEGIAPGRPGAIPLAGAGVVGAGAALAAEDEATNPHFVAQGPEDPSGLFGFPGVPERKKPRKDGARRGPLLAALAAAWVIGLAGVAAFTLGDDDGGGEATPPTTSSTSTSSSTSSTTSSTTEPTSETTPEEVAPAPEPTTEAPVPEETPQAPAPEPTSEPPSPETTVEPEPTETTSETTSEPTETTSETSEPTETPEQPTDPTSEFTQPTREPTQPTTEPEQTEDPAPTSPSGGRGSSTTPGE